MMQPVLRFWSESKAVRQRRFETVKIASNQIDTLVYDQTRQVLTNTLFHDPCLTVANREALFHCNHGGMDRERFNPAGELFIA